jgi:hypothetical protein
LGNWRQPLDELVGQMSGEERQHLERSLGKILAYFEYEGVLPAGAPCAGCRYFALEVSPATLLPHYCHLLQEGISEVEASKDCPDFAITVA